MNTYVYVCIFAIVIFLPFERSSILDEEARKSYLIMIILFALLRTENVLVSNVF